MTSYIPRSPSLNFITSNPATDAFNAGQKAAREAELADLNIQSKIVTNAVDLAAAPSKLRRMNAEASSAESGADVDYRTRDSKVATSGATASRAVTEANVARETAPSRISEAASSARTAGANADVAQGTVGSRIGTAQQGLRAATAGADVAEGTVQPRISDAQSGATIRSNEAQVSTATVPEQIEGKRVGLRQQRATALNTEMLAFYKSLELLNAGDIEGAKAVAAQAGQTIPDQVIQNADTRAAVTRAAQRAKEIYPDRPADQQKFIEGFIGDMAQRRQQGQAANSPTAPYQVPGAPEPQESTTQGSYEIVHRQETDPATGQPVVKSYQHDRRSGELTPIEGTGAFGNARSGAGGRNSVFEQKRAAWLEVNPGDAAGALAYAQNTKQMTALDVKRASLSMAQKELAGNTQLRFSNKEALNAAINQRAIEIERSLLSAGTGAVPSVRPAPGAPAPAASGQLPPAPRDPAQREVNKVYVAPDGRKVKWTGQGWQVMP